MSQSKRIPIRLCVVILLQLQEILLTPFQRIGDRFAAEKGLFCIPRWLCSAEEVACDTVTASMRSAMAGGEYKKADSQRSLEIMDIAVERNAYGRQVNSRVVRILIDEGEMEAVFIRAPIIRHEGAGARVVATYAGDRVWIEPGRYMVTTFHPELTVDTRVHERFLSMLVGQSVSPAAVS